MSRIIKGQVVLPSKGARTDLYPVRSAAKKGSSMPSLSRTDYYAAIRLHILRSLATGTYRTHRMAAEALGVSEVWVGRVVE